MHLPGYYSKEARQRSAHQLLLFQTVAKLFPESTGIFGEYAQKFPFVQRFPEVVPLIGTENFIGWHGWIRIIRLTNQVNGGIQVSNLHHTDVALYLLIH